MFQAFKAKYIGKKVDVDGVPKGAPFQCVDLIKKYLQEDAGLTPSSFGNAVDYWYHTAGAVLSVCVKVRGSDAKEGDIVVLETNKTPIKPGTGEGHIGIATGNINADSIEILEQNGHTGSGHGIDPGDFIRTRWVPRKRVAGLLRLKASHPSHLEAVKNGNTWYVRTQPNTNGSILGVVKRGDVYDTEVLTNDWRKISFKGTTGYVGAAAWV